MFVELHILQNFAPSCLNRDDTGSPKDCEFGGFRRARVSSQCIKRSIRRCFNDGRLMDSADLAVRTKLVVAEVVKTLVAAGRDADQAKTVVKAALGGVKLVTDDKDKTQYLLFLGRSDLSAIADLCNEHWEALIDAADNKKSKKGAKTNKKVSLPNEIQKEIEDILRRGSAGDLALFGRMLADAPNLNIDAASQVAHAISTNAVGREFDFYTAVDDLQDLSSDEGAGAGMMGVVEYNSACFYRYSNVDLAQLLENAGDEELARKTLEAFLRASIEAVPTGKQNSMAAQNPPSLVFAVVRDRGLWSLANAFVDPVRPNRTSMAGGLVAESAQALDLYWTKLLKMYGDKGIVAKVIATTEEVEMKAVGSDKVGMIDELVIKIMASASFRDKE